MSVICHRWHLKYVNNVRCQRWQMTDGGHKSYWYGCLEKRLLKSYTIKMANAKFYQISYNIENILFFLDLDQLVSAVSIVSIFLAVSCMYLYGSMLFSPQLHRRGWTNILLHKSFWGWLLPYIMVYGIQMLFLYRCNA